MCTRDVDRCGPETDEPCLVEPGLQEAGRRPECVLGHQSRTASPTWLPVSHYTWAAGALGDKVGFYSCGHTL